MTLDEFAACVGGKQRGDERAVLITFDDAYRGLRDHAFPVLRDLGFSAACFVITDYAGRLNRWDVAYGGRRFAHLTWRDIEGWHARGIAFGSHTASHPRLPWVCGRQLRDELERSGRALAAALGSVPAVIAYPFGAAGLREHAAAARAGYAIGFGLGGRWRGNPFHVPRHAVHCWSSRLPGIGPLAPVERLVAAAAGRCAVGTSVWLRLTSA